MKKTHIAFTLAEVLITLGVIGIVTAMTLPTLVNKIQEKQFRVMWRKYYSDLANATLLIKANETFDGTEREAKIAELYSKHINNAKICSEKNSTKEGCWDINKVIYDKNGKVTYNEIGSITGGATCMNLNNSSVICFDEIIAIIDVNGSKNPNKIGTDIYAAIIDRSNYIVRPAKGHKEKWGAADGTIKQLTSGDGTCHGKNSDRFGWGCSSEYLLEYK